MDKQTEQCPGGCNHSDPAHNAFDQGVRDGEEYGFEAENPFTSSSYLFLYEAWASGHSVGCLNREYLLKKEAEPAKMKFHCDVY